VKRLLIQTVKTARRIVILAVGSTVVLFGIILLFTPGPACVVIPVGIAILATEFVWARRLLRRLKSQGRSLARAAGLATQNPGPTLGQQSSTVRQDPYNSAYRGEE